MKKTDITDLVRKNLLEIIPELEGEDFTDDTTLVDLGANSIDRGELIMLCLEELDLDVPRVAFAGVESIDDLAKKIFEKGNWS